MTSKAYALARAALIKTLTAYSGITTSDGAFDGTATLIDSNLIDRNDFISGKTILIMSGDAKDEDKGATAFDNSDGKITLQGTGFSAQIKAGTIFRVLNISTVEMDVANIDTKIGTNADPAGTTTLFAWLAKVFASGDDIEGKLDSPAHGLAAIMVTLAAVNAKLVAPATGLAAIINTIAYFGAKLDDPATGLTAIINTLAYIISKLDDPAIGFAAIINTLAAHWNEFIDPAHGFGALANTLTTALTNIAAVETKLDIPANFMADVSALALEATLTAIKGAGWTDENLKTIDELIDAIKADMEAVLDLTGGASETSVMDGTEKELYKEEAGTLIRLFAGINIDWTGLHAGGGEDTTIKAYRKYGANWRKFYEETFLATAVPDPPVTPSPRYIDTQCTPSQVYYKQGIRITAQQAAEGAGWNTLTFDKVTAAPEA